MSEPESLLEIYYKGERDEGRVSFKQNLPEMKEKAAEQAKANPVAENVKKKSQEIDKSFPKQVLRAENPPVTPAPV